MCWSIKNVVPNEGSADSISRATVIGYCPLVSSGQLEAPQPKPYKHDTSWNLELICVSGSISTCKGLLLIETIHVSEGEHTCDLRFQTLVSFNSFSWRSSEVPHFEIPRTTPYSLDISSFPYHRNVTMYNRPMCNGSPAKTHALSLIGRR